MQLIMYEYKMVMVPWDCVYSLVARISFYHGIDTALRQFVANFKTRPVLQLQMTYIRENSMLLVTILSTAIHLFVHVYTAKYLWHKE